MSDPKDYSEAIEPALVEEELGGGVMEELTSEVTPDPVVEAPKKRGRPKKVVVEDASPPEAPKPEPVTVTIVPEPMQPQPKHPVPHGLRVPNVQSMPAQTLAEIEAGRRVLNKYRRV